MPETTTTASPTLEVAELETQRLSLSEVTPHSQNPRIHTEEQIQAIMESLIMDGYIAGSMGIQKSTRTLYKGHGVYEALLNLGCMSADFVVKDLTDAETLALLARDNALSDMSSNDPVKLKADTDLKCGDCQQAQKHVDLSQDRRRCMEGYGRVWNQAYNG